MAERLHAGQLRRDGEPYFRHCERVAAGVLHLGHDARAVGFLHDALEDTLLGYEALLVIFGREIADDVATVTRGFGETYAEYIERVAGGSDVAVAVKLSDIKDNQIGLAEVDVDGALADRYAEARQRLIAEALARQIEGEWSRDPTRPDPVRERRTTS